MAGLIMMNDLVAMNHADRSIYIVSSIDESQFDSRGGWKRLLDLTSVTGGGGVYNADEDNVTLLVSDSRLQALRKRPSDLPDPRERLFG